MKILINAISLHTGGGNVVGIKLIEALIQNLNTKTTLIILVPSNAGYEEIESNFKNKKCMFIYWNKRTQLFYKLFFSLSIWFKVREKYDYLLNLCNIPIKTNKKQIVLLHSPYFVYSEKWLWEKFSFKHKIIAKYKINIFKKNLKYMDFCFVQGNHVLNRLCYVYNISKDKVKILPMSVNFDNLVQYKSPITNSSKIFFYPSRYYEHKNIEILIEVAKIIKNKKIPFQIILTLNHDEHKNARQILKQIKIFNLEHIIKNIGQVKYTDLPSIMAGVDALIMPTLLETFGLPYLEAMYFKKPIFTSDLDFAHCICHNAAIFFNPLNAQDILNKMNLINDISQMKQLIKEGNNILNKYPKDWTFASNSIYEIVKLIENL